MSWTLMLATLLCLLLGAALVAMNVKPPILQVAAFAAALCLSVYLRAYGSPGMAAGGFALAWIGAGLAGAQALGYLRIGPSGTVPF